MPGIPRLCVPNRVAAAAAVLTASDAQAAAPVAWLKDQLRSKTWRSAPGWTIGAGVNDKIDFIRSGTKAATVAPGTYVTGDLLAAAIVAALEAADATPVWACAYSPTTFKFTISSDLAFELIFTNAGVNFTSSIHPCLGFADAATGSAVSHVAGSVSYQSRHWLKADFGSALSVQVGIVVNHNAGTSGTFTLQGNATDAWAAPTVSQALAGDASIRIAFISTQTLRWWRLVINDVGNALGYSEVGIWNVGPYVQPTISYAVGFAKRWEELSEVTVAPSGAHWQDERPRRPVWSISWSEIPEADRASLAAVFALVPKGRNFFFAFDAVTTPTATEYGFLADGVSEAITSGLYYDVPVPAFAGALG